MREEFAGGVVAAGDDGAQGTIEAAGASEAIAADFGVLYDPGAFGRAREKPGEELAAVGAENLAIARQDCGEIFKAHRTGAACGLSKAGGVDGRLGADHGVFLHETEAAIQRLTHGRGVEADARSTTERGERFFHQARADARASLLGIDEHHGDPGERVVAYECDCAHDAAVFLDQKAAAAWGIKEDAPVVFQLVPSGGAAEVHVGGYLLCCHWA